MKVRRISLRLADVERGTAVDLYHDEAVAETKAEAEDLLELRNAAARREADEAGRERLWYKPLIVEDPPFNNRIVLPLEAESGRERAAIFSRQSVDLIFEGHVGQRSAGELSFEPIQSSPETNSDSYACIRGEMNGKPSIGIVSKDRLRAIVVACDDPSVIDGVLHKVLGCDISNKEFITHYFVGHVPLDEVAAHQWDLLFNTMEIIAIRVKRLDQAIRALVKYRRYLD